MIEEIKKTDLLILNTLKQQEEASQRTTAYAIAGKIGQSYGNVMFRFRVLKDAGIIAKNTRTGNYFILPEAEEELNKTMKKRKEKKKELMKKAVKIVTKEPTKAVAWSKIITEQTGIKTVPQDIIDEIGGQAEEKAVEDIAEKKIKGK